MISDPNKKSDNGYSEDLKEGNVDINVQCLIRDDLPAKVKPKNLKKMTRVIPAINPFD